MDWTSPWVLLLALPAAAWLWWSGRRSTHPMPARRRAGMLALRVLAVLAALAALAGPALRQAGSGDAVVVVYDHSASQGEVGLATAATRAARALAGAPAGMWMAAVSAGAVPSVISPPIAGGDAPKPDPLLLARSGGDSDLAAAVDLARGLFPAGTTRRMLLITDGMQTRGDLRRAAREAALAGIPISVIAQAGPARPDVRVTAFTSSRSRAFEGSALTLTAEVEATMAGSGVARLFENGVEAATMAVRLDAGERRRLEFRRTPAERNLFTYRVRLDGFAGDQVPGNDEALALVDVAGRPRLLHLASDRSEARYLAEALVGEGMRVDTRPPEECPTSAAELTAFDGIILADVAARLVAPPAMEALRDYVETFGGGLVVSGGPNSFGVGGWYRTPIEDLLPVKMQATETEEKASVGLALVIDRSGSMSGEPLEMCKQASIATLGLLQAKDYVMVVAFDSQAQVVVPMGRLINKPQAEARVAAIGAGGGTEILPGMSMAYEGLLACPAKTKHMIVLTDGQSSDSGFVELAARAKANRITVSAVAVGDGADTAGLQAIARAGGGKFYLCQDPRQVPRIFTQDAMSHLGKLVREQAFRPRQVERHAMLAGIDPARAPELHGYVRTIRRSTAQVPLVTDVGDPLLAHWRFGHGKVTAFTSDNASRWAGLWLSGWTAGYAQFWTQVVRETAREPQGRRMDASLEAADAQARIRVDLLEDAATWKDGAEVRAEVFHVPVHGGAMRPVADLVLAQDGPGRYAGAFAQDRPGVYLVRVRSGGDTVSAGLVHQPGSESASGRIDHALLADVARITGGSVLADAGSALPPPAAAAQGAPLDLRPPLVALLLALLLLDLIVRRWENVLAIADRLRFGRDG